MHTMPSHTNQHMKPYKPILTLGLAISLVITTTTGAQQNPSASSKEGTGPPIEHPNYKLPGSPENYKGKWNWRLFPGKGKKNAEPGVIEPETRLTSEKDIRVPNTDQGIDGEKQGPPLEWYVRGGPFLKDGSGIVHWDPSTFPNLRMNPESNSGLEFSDVDVSPQFFGAPGFILGCNEEQCWGATVNPQDVTVAENLRRLALSPYHEPPGAGFRADWQEVSWQNLPSPEGFGRILSPPSKDIGTDLSQKFGISGTAGFRTGFRTEDRTLISPLWDPPQQNFETIRGTIPLTAENVPIEEILLSFEAAQSGEITGEGNTIYNFDDHQVILVSNGSTVMPFSNGAVKIVDKDGNTTYMAPNGDSTVVTKEGTVIVKHKDGTSDVEGNLGDSAFCTTRKSMFVRGTFEDEYLGDVVNEDLDGYLLIGSGPNVDGSYLPRNYDNDIPGQNADLPLRRN